MTFSYKTIEIHRIIGSYRPIVAAVYRITEEGKQLQYIVHLTPEEFCEHIFKHIMMDGANETMFERLSQLYRIQQREIEEIGKKLMKSIPIILDDDKDEYLEDGY